MTATPTPEPPRPRQLRNDIRLLAEAFGPLRRRLAVIVVLAVVTAVLEAAIVLAIATAGSMLADGARHVERSLLGVEISMTLGALCLITAGIALLRAVLDMAMVEIKARAEATYDATTREQVARAYLDADWALQADEQAGGLQSALVSFVSFARTVLTKLTDLIVALASFSIMLAASLTIGGLVTVVVLIVMVGFAFLMRPFILANRRSSVRQRDTTRLFATRINEMVSMSREIKVMGIQRPIEGTIHAEVADLRSATYESSTASYRLQSLYTSLTYIAVTAGLGALVLGDVSDPRPYAAMVLLLYRAMVYGRGIQSTYQGITGSIPYLEDLDERISRYRQARERTGDRELGAVGEVAFVDVSFSYDGAETALGDVSFTIESGDAIGVVGPSGAGKSTLVQLLLGLRQPTNGALLVDGHPVSEYTRESWTRRVSLVPQESTLFDRSVIDNVICFRDGISTQRAEAALAAAHVLDELRDMPDGLDTVVGEGGRRLSGGQRQRVCIARALAGDPDLLILDEPTSALDLASEEAIRQTLEGIKGQITLVIVAHRMSTLRVCDKVLVVNDGRLEAFADRATLEGDNDYFSAAIRLAKLV